MASKLLIRVYDVGLGDCILCRIPDGAVVDGVPAPFHMLIDCGSWSGIPFLETALADIATQLPSAGGDKKRLDLLVVTHEHKDHMAGCDPVLFEKFQIGAIWMSAAMNPNHEQAKGAQKLQAFAVDAVQRLVESRAELGPELASLTELFGIDNEGAVKALRKDLPEANGIKPQYVFAGKTHEDFELPLKGAKLSVLGPENDIDGYYLGKSGGAAVNALSDSITLMGPGASASVRSKSAIPTNIGSADFTRLKQRMLSSALAFAALSSKVTNNTSVVLLLEWGGRRLLFVGDAEWDSAFRDGKANSSWNVMWHARKEELKAPFDFLKIGHHGSENATPWGADGEPRAILDAILPKPVGNAKAKAKAVASTQRGRYETIPRSELLAELGQRVANAQRYSKRFAAAGLTATALPKYSKFEEDWIELPQPQRTDCERMLTGVGFVDVEFEAIGP
ncbi:metallohydrolase [Bosea sp. ASV33]|uniref:MBL fold metallo-hydrolase n=1 Tax=Bosea sp. ASV33 TaxID=2795106 RepID=UPI0018EE0189|nr:metallohydrolase [Bosea sp. ASV33]